MLNLNDPIIYTAAEKAHVDSVLKPQKSIGWKDQKDLTKAIKNRISTHTIIAQGGRCAYCEMPLLRGAHAIEHIAPKGIYGEFCYEPYNLVTACSSCNSTSNKGEEDTVVSPANREDYSANRFKVVHPYFDNPDDHLKYIDADHTTFDMANCSQKGKETIRMFHWNETWAISQRQMAAYMRRFSLNVLQRAVEISTYKV